MCATRPLTTCDEVGSGTHGCDVVRTYPLRVEEDRCVIGEPTEVCVEVTEVTTAPTGHLGADGLVVMTLNGVSIEGLSDCSDAPACACVAPCFGFLDAGGVPPSDCE